MNQISDWLLRWVAGRIFPEGFTILKSYQRGLYKIMILRGRVPTSIKPSHTEEYLREKWMKDQSL